MEKKNKHDRPRLVSWGSKANLGLGYCYYITDTNLLKHKYRWDP